MVEIKYPLQKEQYKKLKKLKYTDLYDALCDNGIIPNHYFTAYGVYNVQLKEIDGEYFLTYDRGDSCD